MNVNANGKGVRKGRRTWYRRRLRIQRTLVTVAVGTLLAAACWQNVANYFSLRSLQSSHGLPSSFSKRTNVHKDLALAAARSAKPSKHIARIPGIYPYSVVPGGVKDPSELRSIALRDYVVRRHYFHFDYNQAHLVRATEAREVYLSYRIRDTVYWTRKRVRLHVGELLLTDGKITARARCGNQISESAKPEVSDEEPAEDVLDQPVTGLESFPSWPIRPVLAASDLPSGLPTSPQFSTGGFIFAYVPFSVPPPSGYCTAGDQNIDGHCLPKHRKVTTPEPSTMVLLGSGLALVLWRYRKAARLTVA